MRSRSCAQSEWSRRRSLGGSPKALMELGGRRIVERVVAAIASVVDEVTDKLEITAEAQRLGTFEISIEPDADCCSLFVPKHPATRLGPDEIRAAEARVDVAALVRAGVEGAALEETAWPAPAVTTTPSGAEPALTSQHP